MGALGTDWPVCRLPDITAHRSTTTALSWSIATHFRPPQTAGHRRRRTRTGGAAPAATAAARRRRRRRPPAPPPPALASPPENDNTVPAQHKYDTLQVIVSSRPHQRCLVNTVRKNYEHATITGMLTIAMRCSSPARQVTAVYCRAGLHTLEFEHWFLDWKSIFRFPCERGNGWQRHLNAQHALLHGLPALSVVRRDELGHHHIPRLAQPMAPVDRLHQNMLQESSQGLSRHNGSARPPHHHLFVKVLTYMGDAQGR